MDPYSPVLGLTFVLTALALGATLIVFLTGHRGSGSVDTWTKRVGRGAAYFSLVGVFAAAGSHLIMGHRPGSPSALGPLSFVAEHPALLVVAALAIGALLLLRKR